MNIFYYRQNDNNKESLLTRVWKVIILCAVFFLVTFLQISAKSAAPNVSVKSANRTFKKEVSEVRKQPLYPFSVGHELFKPSNSEGFLIKRKTANKKIIAKSKDWLTHTDKIIDKTIELKAKNHRIKFPSELILPDIQVKGVVIDSATGQPLAGVTLKVKGANIGTVTDAQGQFTIDVSDDAVLEVSFLGYKSKEVSVNNRTSIDISLSATATGLEQLVVIGYGTQKKKDLTGSVAQVNNEELTSVPTYNLGEALQGRASGVSVKNNSGAPGSRIQVRVRGGNSMIGSNNPLYVVDGFPLSGGINFLNPEDIESISILKDASATAIYGARGANGVVIITTKRGKRGQDNVVSINSYYGIQGTAKRFDMLNPKQYATVANEWLKNNGQPPEFDVDQVSNQDATDWQDVIFRAAPVQNHTLTLTGSSEKSNFSFSGSYYKQEGIIINSGVQKGGFRLNLDHEFKSWFNVSVNLNLSRREQNSVPVDNGRRGNNMFSGAISAPPAVPVFNKEGLPTRIGESYSFTDPGDMRNPMLWAKPYKNKTLANTALFNSSLNFRISDDVSFSSRVGLEYENSLHDGFNPIIYPNDRGGASQGSTYWNSFVNENILTFDKTFNAVHHLKAVGGATYQTYMTRNLGASVSGFSNNITENFNLGIGETINTPSSGISKWKLISGLARINYSFSEKYLVTASFRADGSSRFGADNKWGFFPSGAVAWVVSEEPFIKENLQGINNLKLRASYGITGSTALSPYQSLDRMLPQKYIYGGSSQSVGYSPAGISNPELKWERSNELDIGVDLDILKDRIGFTFDYYKKNTHNLLAFVPLPTSTGFESILQNFGEIQNQGLEFSITANILNKGFKWDIGTQVSFNRNKVIKLASESDIITVGQTSGLPGYNIAREGEPLASFYGYLEDGLDEKGYIKFKDINNDGSITSSDRVIMGSPYPDFEYGFNSNISYKNFHLNLFFQGTYGNDIFFATAFTNLNSFQRTQNQFDKLMGNYWTEKDPNPNAKYPKISPLTQMRPSDRFIKDGSYLRLKSLQLSYNFPLNNMSIDWIKNLELYFKVTNLFTITNYPGLDPEVNTRGSDAQSVESRLFIGTDETGYPNARVFGGGINLSF